MPYAIDVPFSTVGRHFVVSNSTHKVSARADKPFACGFCKQTKDGSERYTVLTVHTDSRFPGEDYIEADYIFCDACVLDAVNDFPNLPSPAVERAIVARIERDEPTPRHFTARPLARIAQEREQRILAMQKARQRIDAAFEAMVRLDDAPDSAAYEAARKAYVAAVDAMNSLAKFVGQQSRSNHAEETANARRYTN